MLGWSKLSKEEDNRNRAQYEAGVNSIELARKYGVSPTTINASIRRAGGNMRTAAQAHCLISPTQGSLLRKEYDSGKSAQRLADENHVSREAITSAIKRDGGRMRKISESNRKYFVNSARERSLFGLYRLLVEDMIYLADLQRYKCLWCYAPLPRSIKGLIKAIPDHIGGSETLINKKTVKNTIRGLACPDGFCNMMAGIIGAAPRRKSQGNLSGFGKRVRHVIKTNHGNLFPRT